jgi:hypothetical protein
MPNASLFTLSPWDPKKKIDLVEIDLGSFGARKVPGAGFRFFARPLMLREGMRLLQWVTSTLGSVVAISLSEVLSQIQDLAVEDRARALGAAVMEALPAVIDAAAGAGDWEALLRERTEGIVCYCAPGADPERQPAALVPFLSEDAEQIFGGVPIEAVILVVALVVHGIGPFPWLG